VLANVKRTRAFGKRVHSPYDPEAHYGNKGAIERMGYNVHFTKSCEDGEVHLITQVEMTSAVVPNVEASEPILSALEK
jgi:transposase